MITAALILKILLSSLLGYLALNSFFRYHFASERFQSIAFVLAMIVMFIFKDVESDMSQINIIIIIFAAIGVLYLVFFLVFNKKKQFGYFLLNVNKKEFTTISSDVISVANEMKIKQDDIKYNEATPYYIELHNNDFKKVHEFFKKVDQKNNARKKKITMLFYWHMVVFLILMVAIWRF